MKIFHYLVETPEASFTWIGGEAQPDGDHLWLCGPAGNRLLRVPRNQVRLVTPSQTAKRIVADRQAATTGRN